MRRACPATPLPSRPSEAMTSSLPSRPAGSVRYAGSRQPCSHERALRSSETAPTRRNASRWADLPGGARLPPSRRAGRHPRCRLLSNPSFPLGSAVRGRWPAGRRSWRRTAVSAVPPVRARVQMTTLIAAGQPGKGPAPLRAFHETVESNQIGRCASNLSSLGLNLSMRRPIEIWLARVPHALSHSLGVEETTGRASISHRNVR